MFVADGNFKADHVRQRSSTGDVWLSDGSGMIPKRDEYSEFLNTAKEKRTVSFRLPFAETDLFTRGLFLSAPFSFRQHHFHCNRKRLAKINSKPL